MSHNTLTPAKFTLAEAHLRHLSAQTHVQTAMECFEQAELFWASEHLKHAQCQILKINIAIREVTLQNGRSYLAGTIGEVRDWAREMQTQNHIFAARKEERT